GALPAGLSLNAGTGAIAGTPTAGGSFSFTIRATDAYSFTGSRAYSVIVAAPGIALSSAMLAAGQVSSVYSQTVSAGGGTAPYTYSVVSGALPAGLSLAGGTGAISGTPTAAGTYSFTIKAADSSTGTGSPYFATRAYSISIIQQAPVASARIVAVAYNTPTAIDLTPAISGGTPVSVALATVPGHGTALVSGLIVTYTPAASYSGADSFTYTATNAGGSSSPALVSIAVSAPPPTVSSINPVSGSSAGGTMVTLNGSGFQNVTAVNFGAVSASFSIVSSSVITVTAPAGSAGKVNITVNSPTGTSNVSAGNQYTYLSVGTLTFATPNAASVVMTDSLTNAATSSLSGGSYGAISYSSSNTAVATVNSNGVVTPVSVGSSTITASQAAVSGVNVAASQSYLLTVSRNIQAPLHLSSDKSAIYKTTGTATLQTTGGSGSGALSYALTSGSCSLTGNVLAAGNTTGNCVVTVTKAADANFSAATASVTVVVQNLLTSNVTLSSSNLHPLQGQSITLTATVNPNTVAGVVSFMDGNTVLGSGNLNGGVATYTTNALTVASHSLSAKYAGDASTAAASSEVLTITVASRPVPAVAAAVKGQVESHTATTHRFAMAQMNNIYSHVQLLHNDFKVRNNFGIGLNAPNLDVLSLVGNKIISNYDGLNAKLLPGHDWYMGKANNAEASRMASAPFVRDGEQHGRADANRDSDADPEASMAKPNPDLMRIAGMPVGIWGAGNIDYGSLNALDGTANKFSSSGLTLGMDMMLHAKLIMGASIGYAKDTTTIDLLGSESKSRQWSASLYASYKPEKNWFIDVVAGHGRLNFDNHRWSEIDSMLLSGDRSGKVDYASFSLTRDMLLGRTRFQPFGRFDILNAKMDSYTEQGGNFGLTYNDSSFTNTAFTGGLSLLKDIYYGFGQVTPSLKVQLTHRTSGDVNQSMYYSDLGPNSANYNVVVSGTPENMQALGLGLNVKTRSGLMLNLGWLGSLGSNSYHANSFKLDMRFGF
ncbi:MAG: autotransporter domain-containing protein, partial [Burkholderiales bacterium]|nr:autotransporter domain-containing protein [Burkholderiales bacterium]